MVSPIAIISQEVGEAQGYLEVFVSCQENTAEFNRFFVNADQVLCEVLTIRQQPFNIARMIKTEDSD